MREKLVKVIAELLEENLIAIELIEDGLTSMREETFILGIIESRYALTQKLISCLE